MKNLGQFSIFMEKNIKNIFHDLPYFNANIFSREQIKNKNSAECLRSLFLKILHKRNVSTLRSLTRLYTDTVNINVTL